MENMEQTATNTSHNESGISPLGISHISASGNTITLKCSACGSEMSLGREYFTMILLSLATRNKGSHLKFLWVELLLLSSLYLGQLVPLAHFLIPRVQRMIEA